MEVNRKPFQGLLNVVRFNWQFFVIAVGASTVMSLISIFLPDIWQILVLLAASMILITTLISLLATYWVYDRSGLYAFKWLDQREESENGEILNINAGFDETSHLLAHKFPDAELSVCDFYDPALHTEVSIKRARLAYPPYPGTIKVKTHALPFEDDKFDKVCAIFAAHEIRDQNERQQFFKELKRVTKPTGKIYVTEHLRDFNNFLAYTIGFLHFHSHQSWIQIFKGANLQLVQEQKTTALVSTFILTKNGTTS